MAGLRWQETITFGSLWVNEVPQHQIWFSCLNVKDTVNPIGALKGSATSWSHSSVRRANPLRQDEAVHDLRYVILGDGSIATGEALDLTALDPSIHDLARYNQAFENLNWLADNCWRPPGATDVRALYWSPLAGSDPYGGDYVQFQNLQIDDPIIGDSEFTGQVSCVLTCHIEMHMVKYGKWIPGFGA